jgi:2'-5' RNA ligase
MKRLFIAIKNQPDPALIELVNSLKRKLIDDQINWVSINQLHLTFKFIGETEEKSVIVIQQAMAEAVRGFQPISLLFDKTGIFGSSYDPRVIWIGPKQTNPEVIRLGDSLIRQLDLAGFPRERQNFVPHLTLGRIKSIHDKARFQAVLKAVPEQIFQKSEISEIILFESILRREGPLYKELFKVPLT